MLAKQGFLTDIEWRHRLDSGTYFVRAQGIRELNPTEFVTPPLGAGDKTLRGALNSGGEFKLNDKWKFGWDVTLLSDRYFFSDYALTNPLFSNPYFRENSSTAYLTGKGERSWFDLRGYHFQGLSPRDYSPQMATAAPILDYNRTFPLQPEKSLGIGGEFELDANVSFTTAEAALYESIRPRVRRLRRGDGARRGRRRRGAQAPR